MYKDYPYKDIDGNHWPDAPLGSDLFYSIDYSTWIVEEGDVLVSATWELPSGVTGTEAHEASGQAYIKIKAEERGSHHIKCTLTTTENGYNQNKVVNMVLKVY